MKNQTKPTQGQYLIYIFSGNSSSNLGSNVIYSQNSVSSFLPLSLTLQFFILLTCASISLPTHAHVQKVMFYSTQVSCAGISSLAVSGTKELPRGVTHLLSYSYLPLQVSRSHSPFMVSTTTRRCGQTQR